MVGKSNQTKVVLAAAVVAVVGSLTTEVRAADGTWNADVSGSWQDNTKWTGGIVADGTGFTANFNTDITGDRTITVDAGRTIGNLTFTDTATGTAGSWILSGNPLTLDVASGASTVTVNALGTNKVANVGVVTGNDGLTKEGAGTLVLSGANSVSGVLTVNAGTLAITGSNTFTSTTIGTTGTLNIGNATAGGSLGSGTITVNNTTANQGLLFNRTDDVTLANSLAGAGRIAVNGPGVVTLTGSSTHNGILGISGNRTLRGSDANAAGGNYTVTSVFGAGSGGVFAFGGNSTLDLRANGTDDTTAQTLTFTTRTLQGSNSSFTINVDRVDGTLRGNKTIATTGSPSITTGQSLTVTGGNGYSLQLPSVGIGGSAAGALTLNPTTANLRIVGNVTTSNTANPTLTLSGSATGNSIGGIISNHTTTGTTSVNKIGTSTWTLGGASTYSGGTSVTSGTLLLNNTTGSGTGKSDVTVSGSGVLGGTNGTINMEVVATVARKLAVNSGGHLSPGAGLTTTGILNIIGTQTASPSAGLATVNLASGAFYDVNLTGAVPSAGTTYDQVNVVGTVDLGGADLVLNTTGLALGANQFFTIVKNDLSDALLGTFNAVADGSTVYTDGAYNLVISYFGNSESGNVIGTGNDVILYTQAVAVPEPASLGVAALAVGAIAMRRRRGTN